MQRRHATAKCRCSTKRFFSAASISLATGGGVGSTTLEGGLPYMPSMRMLLAQLTGAPVFPVRT